MSKASFERQFRAWRRAFLRRMAANQRRKRSDFVIWQRSFDHRIRDARAGKYVHKGNGSGRSLHRGQKLRNLPKKMKDDLHL
jgi:hypothetical protein